MPDNLMSCATSGNITRAYKQGAVEQMTSRVSGRYRAHLDNVATIHPSMHGKFYKTFCLFFVCCRHACFSCSLWPGWLAPAAVQPEENMFVVLVVLVEALA
jgi:hypothetical protein